MSASTSTPPSLPTVRAALLFFGLLAISSFVYVEMNHHRHNSNSDRMHDLIIEQQYNEEVDTSSTTINNSDETDNHNQLSLSYPRRRLQSLKPIMNATQQQQQMRSYLGGLYPQVDKDMIPLFLREANQLDYSSTERDQPESTDLVFFWHIPKVYIYICMMILFLQLLFLCFLLSVICI